MRKLLIFLAVLLLVGAVGAASAGQVYQDQYGRLLAYNQYGQLVVVQEAPTVTVPVAPAPQPVPQAQIKQGGDLGKILLGALIIGGAIVLEHNLDDGRRHHNPPRHHGDYRDYGRYRPRRHRYAW